MYEYIRMNIYVWIYMMCKGAMYVWIYMMCKGAKERVDNNNYRICINKYDLLSIYTHIFMYMYRSSSFIYRSI
jgi:hypothetical protein